MRSFFAVWTKNTNYREILKVFDENSIEKLNFIMIFVKFVNRASGNNTIFLQQFFRVRGGEFSPLPPPKSVSGDEPFAKFIFSALSKHVPVRNYHELA